MFDGDVEVPQNDVRLDLRKSLEPVEEVVEPDQTEVEEPMEPFEEFALRMGLFGLKWGIVILTLTIMLVVTVNLLNSED